jgi:hypothetical protein
VSLDKGFSRFTQAESQRTLFSLSRPTQAESQRTLFSLSSSISRHRVRLAILQAQNRSSISTTASSFAANFFAFSNSLSWNSSFRSSIFSLRRSH